VLALETWNNREPLLSGIAANVPRARRGGAQFFLDDTRMAYTLLYLQQYQ